MGGRVLDYEAKRIKNEGREEGKEEGIVEGKAAGIVETGVDFGLSDKEILDKLQIKLNISLQMARQRVGQPGIGGTCGAERGKSRHLGKRVTTVLLRVRKRKKSL